MTRLDQSRERKYLMDYKNKNKKNKKQTMHWAQECLRVNDNELTSNLPMIETVALADPLTVLGGTLSSRVRDKLDAAAK